MKASRSLLRQSILQAQNDYKTNTGVYNGATGGYTATADLYIQVSASAEFSVANFKNSLDKADYIIAYGGTTTADSSESRDRSSVDLPATEVHVQQICDAYPEKTIVVLQTVGQINVENFKDKCAALLWTSYNGQKQGEALGKILTGVVNPSGKLSTTWYTKADLDKMPIGSEREKIDGIDYNFTNYELSNDINNPTAEYPGRTYQYYTGTPVYPFGYGLSYTNFAYSNIQIDKSNADANDIVTITADITNTGSVKGTEVAQLYITVPGADGKTLPLKQLKGFERVELEPNETKSVAFKLNISDVFFFDEASQKNYVVNGEYTAKVGGSSNDANAQEIKFNVSGNISETIKNVYNIPTGLKVYGAKDSAGVVTPASTINADTSVTLKNDLVVTDFAASGITVTYTSANTDVATVDENGVVKSGTQEGTTTITVTAEKDGSTATASFPVVTQFKEKIADSVKANYLKQLEDTYNSCPQIAYTAENWENLNSIYNEAHSAVNAALLDDGLSLLVSKAVKEMLNVPKIVLIEEYTVQAVNQSIIADNRIEYSANGIGEYTATETAISGTITESNPATINMQALSGGSSVTNSLIWSVERLDGSSRKNAEIDIASGVLKIYTNGVYKISASDYPNRKCGSITVYANLQIEGENADNGGGANLNDEKDGASGGKDAGSTNSYWLRYDGVKLDTLTDITFRVSQKDAESTINVSLMPNSDWIIATATAPKTGAWTTWAEVTAEVNRRDLSRKTLDENGCGTIYIQTNKANLDYIKFNDNKYKVNIPYESGVLLATSYENDAMTKSAIKEFTAPGEYVIDGFTAGDNAKIFAWNNLSEVKPLGEPMNPGYDYPAKSLLVYNFSDSAFDPFFDSAEGTQISSGFGMDGYGGWNTTNSKTSYKYNGRTYNFTRALKGGNGTEDSRKMFFTPDADGAVTALFKANNQRCMYIEQGANKVEKFGTDSICEVQLNVKAGEPVYIYGGGANKDLYAVIFEANKEVIEVTPPPTATPVPTEGPLPDTDMVNTVQFEECSKSWTSKAREGSTSKADGGKMIENTSNGDIFYFGEYNTDGLLVINIKAAIRADAGNAAAEFFAADISGIDIANASKSDIEKLLTSNNSLGKKALISDPSKWDNYYDHNIILNSAVTGNKGIFVKMTTDGKYAGNLDYVQLKYNLSQVPSSITAESDILTAANNTEQISIADDTIILVDLNSGEATIIDYSEQSGKDVTFQKVIDWNNSFTALAHNNQTGKSEILGGTSVDTWGNITPVSYAEKAADAPNAPVINDICAANDQLYAGCDGGWLITMTSCSKCSTIKKVCDFDIKSVICHDDTLKLYGEDSSTDINLADARQNNIKGEAAKELAKNGALLVDVRSAEEFASDSINGSLNIPIDGFAEWLERQSDDTIIIVYCSAGTRAAKAMEIAAKQGFTNIYNLGSIDELR